MGEVRAEGDAHLKEESTRVEAVSPGKEENAGDEESLANEDDESRVNGVEEIPDDEVNRNLGNIDNESDLRDCLPQPVHLDIVVALVLVVEDIEVLGFLLHHGHKTEH